MIVFLSQDPATVFVTIRAEIPTVLGDLTYEVREGGHFLGHSYEELKEMGRGRSDLTEKKGAAQ